MLKEGRFRLDIGKKSFTRRVVKPLAESSWSPEGTGSARVAPHFPCTSDPSFPKCQPREGMWELHTPELLHEVLLRDLLWSNNLSVEQQLLLWREPGISGKHEVLQLCRGSEAEVCREQRLLCLELFFQVLVLKKGNKQSKETSPVTACPPTKAFFGQGWSLASFATKQLAGTSYF